MKDVKGRHMQEESDLFFITPSDRSRVVTDLNTSVSCLKLSRPSLPLQLNISLLNGTFRLLQHPLTFLALKAPVQPWISAQPRVLGKHSPTWFRSDSLVTVLVELRSFPLERRLSGALFPLGVRLSVRARRIQSVAFIIVASALGTVPGLREELNLCS